MPPRYDSFLFISNHSFIKNTCDCNSLVCMFDQVDIGSELLNVGMPRSASQVTYLASEIAYTM